MIAHVIVAHSDFDALWHLFEGLYDQSNLYCICVNQGSIAEAAIELEALRALPNVYVVSTPPTCWGGIVESVLTGIDFCLRVNRDWSSLIINSASDINVMTPQAIAEKIANEYAGKIILNVFTAPADTRADEHALDRLYRNPLGAATGSLDLANYSNPFPYKRKSYQREGMVFNFAPGAARPGWPRKDTNFVAFLSPMQNRADVGEVYFEHQSPFVRRALSSYFQYRNFGTSVFYGIFPRDFCEFIAFDPEALTLLSMVRNTFAAEENYIPTLAMNWRFTNRLVYLSVFYPGPNGDMKFGLSDIESISITYPHIMFARKMPADRSISPTYEEVRTACGIHGNPIVPAARRRAGASGESATDLFWDLLEIGGTQLEFGVLGSHKLCNVSFSVDGGITCDFENIHIAGSRWVIEAGRLNIYDFNNDLYAVFETARSADGILTLCGYWLHVPDLNLALVGSVEKNLNFSSSPSDNQKIGQLGLLNAQAIFWICGQDPIKLEIRESGRIDMPNGSRAKWSISGDFLVLSGLSNLPLASFRLSAGLAVPYRLPGTVWGRFAPVETCELFAASSAVEPSHA